MFNFFKNSTNQNLPEIWTVPEQTSEIDTIFEDKEGCYLIYKHSYRCSTCIFTMQSLNKYADQFKGITKAYFIDVVAQRALSNHVAQVSGVRHESPQALLIYKGDVFWHDSHSGVRGELVLECLEELFPA